MMSVQQDDSSREQPWQQPLHDSLRADIAPWLQQLRRRGASQFTRLQWPTPRQEAWKYTNVSAVANTAFSVAPEVAMDTAVVAATGGLGGPCVVFVNGHLCAPLCRLPEQNGVAVQALSAAAHHPDGVAQQYLGSLHLGERRVFAALADAFADDGVCIELAAQCRMEAPLELVFVNTQSADGAPWMTYPRITVVAHPGAVGSIVERHIGVGDGVGATLSNSVTELFIKQGAVLHHTVLQTQHQAAYHIATIAADVAQDAELTSHVLSLGGQLSRHDVSVQLAGQRSRCGLSGLYLGRDKQHHDLCIEVAHQATHGTSQQLYKGILDDHAVGVFCGNVHVAVDAIKTDARQLNQNVLLSQHATAHTRPQLMILADDVKCSHGATVGQLDDDAVFYLQSRGLDAATTQRLLTYAFGSDAIAACADPKVRILADALLRRWLQLPNIDVGEAAEVTGVTS